MSDRWQLQKQRRHKCDGCGAIFDCSPCPHYGRGKVDRLEVFCTPECEAKQKSDKAEPVGRGNALKQLRNGIHRR